MKILTSSRGSKDYYDYLQGTLGQDELVVYDRRDAFVIDPTKVWGDDIDKSLLLKPNSVFNFNIERWFRKEVIYGDKKKEYKRKWKSNKVSTNQKITAETEYATKKSRNSNSDDVLEGDVYHFLLEVGYYHYIFEVERYIDDKDPKRIHLDYDLVKVERVDKDKRVSYAPMSICPVTYVHHYFYNEGDTFKIPKDGREEIVTNPILYRTYIPKFISAYDIWNQLYEYISSLRDKDFVDSRTNDEHIESHGFDKKISFRHRK